MIDWARLTITGCPLSPRLSSPGPKTVPSVHGLAVKTVNWSMSGAVRVMVVHGVPRSGGTVYLGAVAQCTGPGPVQWSILGPGPVQWSILGPGSVCPSWQARSVRHGRLGLSVMAGSAWSIEAQRGQLRLSAVNRGSADSRIISL